MTPFEQGFFTFMKCAGLVSQTFSDDGRVGEMFRGLGTGGIEGAIQGARGHETDFDMAMNALGAGSGLGVGALAARDMYDKGQLPTRVMNVIRQDHGLEATPLPGVMQSIRRGVSDWAEHAPRSHKALALGLGGIATGMTGLELAGLGKGLHERYS